MLGIVVCCCGWDGWRLPSTLFVSVVEVWASDKVALSIDFTCFNDSFVVEDGSSLDLVFFSFFGCLVFLLFGLSLIVAWPLSTAGAFSFFSFFFVVGLLVFVFVLGDVLGDFITVVIFFRVASGVVGLRPFFFFIVGEDFGDFILVTSLVSVSSDVAGILFLEFFLILGDVFGDVDGDLIIVFPSEGDKTLTQGFFKIFICLLVVAKGEGTFVSCCSDCGAEGRTCSFVFIFPPLADFFFFSTDGELGVFFLLLILLSNDAFLPTPLLGL